MTKEQALKLFRETHADYLTRYKNDITAKNTAWHQFTDSLCKEGQITQKQYDTWGNPY